MELLASNHEGDTDKSSVWCYTVPSDIVNGEFKKTLLAKGFVTKKSILPGSASPGFVYAVYPKMN